MSGPEGSTRLKVVPLTLPAANRYVGRWHRHHAPIPPGFPWWSVAAVDPNGAIVGVGIAGRPTNRNSDDGQTVEVLRVATTGHPNACSVIYGACARAAKAVGAWRIITYTLDEETGSSLRGSGWERQKDGITSWWLDEKTRTPAVARPHMAMTKVRWGLTFRPIVVVNAPIQDQRPGQSDLGLGS